MESSIWLLAYLFSREIFISLDSFQRAVSTLREGVELFSADFLHLHPELRQLGLKYSPAKLLEYEEELCRAVEKGYLLLYPGHPFFPDAFLDLEEVPFLLRLQGSPIWLGLQGLSIVGHREPSHFSLAWMEEHLASFLRSTTCFTVSGGARGVDQKAHSLSLRTGRPTVAFVPAGLEKIYPSSLASWVPDILAGGGALISEYENLRPMQKHFFAQRNRLISGLGRATLIIEARRHSGTLLTAREAIEQSRPLWVLPGHPMDPNCQGSLDLMIDGATPVQCAEDLGDLFASEVQGISFRALRLAKDLVGDLHASH